MARQQSYPTIETLRKLEACLCVDPSRHDAWESELDDADDSSPRWSIIRCFRLFSLGLWSPLFSRLPRLRKFVVFGGALGALVLFAMVALWWRLSSGPIELDIATPWLSAAIKQNFGSGHKVEIGGTQLERDANGRPSLRIRDIVVRDADGAVVASAPKAEVGISGRSLLIGRIRAERLSLVGAEMAVRIELDSRLTVFAGSNKRAFVTAAALSTPLVTGSAPSKVLAPVVALPLPITPAGSSSRAGLPDFAA